MAVLLDNPVRGYAWGSPTVIPELLGRSPTGEPQAELWVGAHPGAPSRVIDDGRSLADLVAADPEATLGAKVVRRFGPQLPFLLKVLAVERPLSIQVHPSREQAVAGFAAEDAAGVPLDAPQRIYRDRNHKPEMVVALGDFEALAGFAEPAEVAERLRGFGRRDLDGAADVVQTRDGLKIVARSWLTASDLLAARLVEQVSAVAADVEGEPFALVRTLAQEFPGDRGVLFALLMRHLRLRPGEAVFVGAGVPHVYLRGVAIEAQASSDNTVRAGLTPKHVDRDEVAELLVYEPGGALRVDPVPSGPGESSYPVPGVEDFRLSRVEPAGSTVRLTAGPRLVLVVEGALRVDTATGSLPLVRGAAAFVPATDDVTLGGHGVAFTVTTALDAAG